MQEMKVDYTLHKVYVYIIYNCEGLKHANSLDLFYIGQTKQPLKERHFSHKTQNNTFADKMISTHKYYIIEE